MNDALAPVISSVAITASVPRNADDPALPVMPGEQAESAPSSDPAVFRQVLDGVRRHCTGMIVHVSTGGRGRSTAETAQALDLAPDMAPPSTGSVNLPSIVYENPPALAETLARRMPDHAVEPQIEVFDLSHLHGGGGPSMPAR